MSLIERVRRLDVLYLEWDRAYLKWARCDSRRNHRRERHAWRRYARLRDSSAGLS